MNKDIYNKCHNIEDKIHNITKQFENLKKKYKLVELLQAAKPSGELLWEVPKGRKNKNNKKKESDLFCAMREAFEETGYSKSAYYILPNTFKRVVYTKNNIRSRKW